MAAYQMGFYLCFKHAGVTLLIKKPGLDPYVFLQFYATFLTPFPIKDSGENRSRSGEVILRWAPYS